MGTAMDKNRSLQQKLDSLDELPVGYEPNLNSKWEVLETALHGKTQRKSILIALKPWLRVAAMLLLIGGAGLLLIKKPTTKTANVVPMVSPIPQVMDDKPELVQSHLTPKPTKYVVQKRNNIVEKREEQTQVVTLAKDSVIINTAEVAAEIAAIAAKPNKFTEVDFTEPANVQTNNEAMVKAQKFRFKLGFGNTEQVGATKSIPLFKTGFNN